MQELNWTNKEDITIQARYWPVDHPIAVITLVHGLGEHTGRYDHVADWFNSRSVSVLGYDHQGFGRSGGKRGHVRSLDALLDDIGQALGETARRQPDVPHFLYGHSMGGNLVLNYLFRRFPDLAGVISTGPWVRLAFPAPLVKVLAGRLLHRLLPALQMPNGLDPTRISRDPAVVDAYTSDPLVHDQLSLMAGIQLLDAANWLDRFSGETPLPVLLQHGGADQITSASATHALAGRLSGRVDHREWPDLYHEIHQEAEKEEVFAFTLDWMKTTMGTK
ncbi:MAG: alpha/beta hydrolase [Bacteroidetes bacterium]|nr:MAG: alpha/beta hydrolase [Bacteroidota bacterium]